MTLATDVNDDDDTVDNASLTTSDRSIFGVNMQVAVMVWN